MAKRTQFTTTEQSFILQARSARLATADGQGTPSLVPICYAFDGNAFYTPLDEKPKRVEGKQLKRVRNIQTRPEVSLLFDQYADDWSQLGYILIHGRATLEYPGSDTHQRALPLLRERYIQYHMMALEQAPIIMIIPYSITSWGPIFAQD